MMIARLMPAVGSKLDNVRLALYYMRGARLLEVQLEVNQIQWPPDITSTDIFPRTRSRICLGRGGDLIGANNAETR